VGKAWNYLGSVDGCTALSNCVEPNHHVNDQFVFILCRSRSIRGKRRTKKGKGKEDALHQNDGFFFCCALRKSNNQEEKQHFIVITDEKVQVRIAVSVQLNFLPHLSTQRPLPCIG
jgi:hypothetical protein